MVHDALILLGELGIWIALLMSGWSTVVSFVGSAVGRRDLETSGRRALHVSALALLLAVAGLVEALVARDFTLAYVARNTSLQLSTLVAASAVWAEPAGGAIVAAWVVAMCGSAIVASTPSTRATARFTGIVSATLCVALAMMVTLANPYQRLRWLAGDGAGLNPLLRHLAPALARPSIVVGFATGVIAAAMGAAGIAAGEHRWRWMRRSHRWSLAAWTLVSLGLLLALRGAYLHTGIAGLWRPAPDITTAALVWLGGTIAIHLAGERGARPPGRVGETVAHVGAGIVFVILLAGRFTGTQSVELRTGQTVEVRDSFGRPWQLVGQGVSEYSADGHDITAVSVVAAHGRARSGLLVARLLQFGGANDSVSTRMEAQPALVHTVLGDLRIVPESVLDDSARVRVSVVPLAWLFWIGGVLVVAGGCAALAFGGPGPSMPEERT